MWLLDTNIWIQYLSQRPNPLQQYIASLLPEQLLLCDIVKAELLFGAYKSQRRQFNLKRLNTLFALIHSLPFDEKAAHHFGEIRTYLEQAGTPIGPYDLLIAATARAHQIPVVTHNVREFSRVPDLQVIDWLAENP